jgi:hypothetical protein
MELKKKPEERRLRERARRQWKEDSESRICH